MCVCVCVCVCHRVLLLLEQPLGLDESLFSRTLLVTRGSFRSASSRPASFFTDFRCDACGGDINNCQSGSSLVRVQPSGISSWTESESVYM
jgi:hypothetical protein